MLDSCLWRCKKGDLDVRTVVMDRWYAITKLMVKIHRAGLYFCCPIKPNRAVSEVKPDEKYRYQKAEELSWREAELDLGKHVHLREFPQGLDLKLKPVNVVTLALSVITLAVLCSFGSVSNVMPSRCSRRSTNSNKADLTII
ncbi:MAG: hypothetical protein ACRCYY_13850, partial [Trueperaceae bacterium]